MTTDDIILAAYNGALPNGVMRLPERLLYQTVKCISQAYKTAQIDAQTASKRKADAINDYRADKVEYENGIDAMRRRAIMYKDIELITTAYRKDENSDNPYMNRLLEVLYGL